MQSKPTFLDAHTHLQFPPYDADRDAVIARARAAGVKMILVGTQFSTSLAGVKLAARYPGEMWAAVGFHPAHATDSGWYHDKNEQPIAQREIFNAEAMRELALKPEVVAIGECGLDYYRMPGVASDKRQETGDMEQAISDTGQETRDMEQATRYKEEQKKLFAAQIQIAREVKKPLMIHCRNAFPDLISMLSDSRSALRASRCLGLIHFFTGTPDDARALLDLGYSFTFGGVITFSRDYDEVIKTIPVDRILSETDAPYVAPAPYRGKRNEPAYVVEVVKKLAESKNISVEQMADQIWANARRIFALK